MLVDAVHPARAARRHRRSRVLSGLVGLLRRAARPGVRRRRAVARRLRGRAGRAGRRRRPAVRAVRARPSPSGWCSACWAAGAPPTTSSSAPTSPGSSAWACSSSPSTRPTARGRQRHGERHRAVRLDLRHQRGGRPHRGVDRARRRRGPARDRPAAAVRQPRPGGGRRARRAGPPARAAVPRPRRRGRGGGQPGRRRAAAVRPARRPARRRATADRPAVARRWRCPVPCRSARCGSASPSRTRRRDCRPASPSWPSRPCSTSRRRSSRGAGAVGTPVCRQRLPAACRTTRPGRNFETAGSTRAEVGMGNIGEEQPEIEVLPAHRPATPGRAPAQPAAPPAPPAPPAPQRTPAPAKEPAPA